MHRKVACSFDGYDNVDLHDNISNMTLAADATFAIAKELLDAAASQRVPWQSSSRTPHRPRVKYAGRSIELQDSSKCRYAMVLRILSMQHSLADSKAGPKILIEGWCVKVSSHHVRNA